MPFMIPSFQHVNMQNNLAATPSATTWGTTITGTTTSASGKGAWTQLISSTTFETNLLTICWSGTALSAALTTDMSLDIGIGASGAENVLIPDLLVGWCASPPDARQISMPIYIPAASRISGRVKTSIANDTVDVAIFCHQGPSGLVSPLFNRCDVYGVTAPSGTDITPGNSGAESAWANIGGTTRREYGASMLLFQGTNTSAMTGVAYHFEWGIGGNTVGEVYCLNSVGESSSQQGYVMPVNRNIPASAQLQARGECSGTAQVMDVAIYCFY